MSEKLLGGFVEQAVHIHASALSLAVHCFKGWFRNPDVVLHKRLVPIIALDAIGGDIRVNAPAGQMGTATLTLR
jgi:hypothetical protein